MKTMKDIPLIIRYVGCLVALAMWACSDSDRAGVVPADVCYDFVTVSSMDDTGTDFTLRKSEDSELITYTTRQVFPDTLFEPGERVIIQYKRADNERPYTSGPVDVYGYRPLDNTMQKLVYANDEEWITDLLDVVSLTRTGEYINLQARLYCLKAIKPNMLILEMEADQLELPCPKLRVAYKQHSPGQNYFKGYASFDISALWNRPTCQGVTISAMGPDGEQTSTFMK